MHFRHISQLKFSQKIWNNISVGGAGPLGPTPWLRPYAHETRIN